MIRQRFERTLAPVWRFNAWYDGLTVRRMEQDRFIIFMSLMVIGMCLPPTLLFILGLPYIVGQFCTVAFYTFLGLTRIYYMDYLQKE